MSEVVNVCGCVFSRYFYLQSLGYNRATVGVTISDFVALLCQSYIHITSSRHGSDITVSYTTVVVDLGKKEKMMCFKLMWHMDGTP